MLRLLRAERTRSSPVLLRTGTRTLLEDNTKREGSMLGPGTGGVTAGSASSSAELPKTEEDTATFRIERVGTTEAENAVYNVYLFGGSNHSGSKLGNFNQN